MKMPVLDGRSLDDLRRELARLSRAYTPEWRLEGPEDDPGAAIAELFCSMLYQTIQRWNAVPERLYLEFLNQIGYQEPGPSPSQGILRFTPHETMTDPVPVPGGTQVFTPDAAGENIVFETERPIQATSARILDIFSVDAARDQIRLLSMDRPQRFFAPEGVELQRHGLALGQEDALLLDCPAVITLRPRREAQYLEEEAVKSLTAEDLHWYFLHDGEEIPFDAVRGERNEVILEKRNRLSIDLPPTLPEGGSGGAAGSTGAAADSADGASNGAGGTAGGPSDGWAAALGRGPDDTLHRCVYCKGRPAEDLTLESVSISSAPVEECPAWTLFSGDVPMDRETGDYCFTRRPGLYSLFYLRCDTVLSKRNALACLRLNLTFVVDAPPVEEPAVAYGRSIIDRQGAVAPKPDDVYISGVVWEYYNGLGWKNLAVSGNRNPFRAVEAGQGEVEITFTVPADMTEIEVNAETGLYIRARVTDIENQYSMLQKWIVPFVQEALFTWQYREPPLADWAAAENNGARSSIPSADRAAGWHLPALRVMEPGEQAMYFRFHRSPHAMPLSLRFWMEGRTRMEEEIQWEARTAAGFETAQCVDRTGNLLHSGEMYLFLPRPLAETELFGRRGYWLRMRRTTLRPGACPVVRGVELNTVGGVQVQRQGAQRFDTDVYEVDKTISLMTTPVQACRVWVDELSALSEEDARTLAEANRGRVVLEEADRQVTRCWVLWVRAADLALAGPEDRVYTLDPWTGEIRFGDGKRGKVPPQGTENILVEYASTRGDAGNVPAGTVDAPLRGLPRISVLSNVTAMSGGTGRLDLERMEAVGNRRLRHRGRAGGRQDFEDLVAELFPQVRHVRCFPGRDEKGADAPGHVTVVIAGHGEQGESMDALCGRVYQELEGRSSCCLTAEGRLHVCPAVELTVNVQTLVELYRPEYAAETQQELVRRLNALIDREWRSRPIGEQVRISEIWSTVRETENVKVIGQILTEGAYDDEGIPRLVPLDYSNAFPYAVVRNGTHTVNLV